MGQETIPDLLAVILTLLGFDQLMFSQISSRGQLALYPPVLGQEGKNGNTACRRGLTPAPAVTPRWSGIAEPGKPGPSPRRRRRRCRRGRAARGQAVVAA